MAPLDSSRPQGANATDSYDAVSALSNEILLHNQHSRNESVLTNLFSHVWDGGSGQSLNKLNALEAQAQAAQKSGDAQALQRIDTESKQAITADQKALESGDTGLGYATGALKTFGLFMGNRWGLAATLGVYALDNAKSGDSLGGQVCDGLLGAGKGLALRKTFEYTGKKGWGPIEQGVSIGFASRFSDLALTRSTYNNGFLSGLGDSFTKAADPYALALDAGTFVVARGLLGGANSLSGGRLLQSRLASTMATGGAFGITTGSTNEIVREQNNGEGFNLGKVLSRGLIQGGIDSLAAAPGGFVAARDAGVRNTQSNNDGNRNGENRVEGLKGTLMPSDAARPGGREFVVTQGQEALNRFMSEPRDSQGAMLKVRALMAGRQGSEQSLFIQHLGQDSKLVRTAADLSANCVPEGTQAGADHVLPGVEGPVRLSANNEGNRIAFTTSDTTAPGYERSVELGGNGEDLQRELLSWVFKANGEDSPLIPPEMQEARRLRASMQRVLKDGNWVLFETAKGSAADNAKMDYLLVNKTDGHWTFFDTTADPESKQGVSPLRRPTIVVIQTEEGSPSLESRMDFMQQVIDATRAETPFNAREILPPSWSATKTDAEHAADLARFRKQVMAKAVRLESQSNLPDTDPYERVQVIDDARLLRLYDDELSKAQKFANRSNNEQADPEYPRHLKSFEDKVNSTTRGIVGNMVAKGSTSPEYSSGATRTKVEYNKQYDELTVFANGQRFRIANVTAKIEDAVRDVVHGRKGLTDYDLKRRLLAGQTTESVRTALVMRLEHNWSGELIGEPGLKDDPPPQPGQKKGQQNGRGRRW